MDIGLKNRILITIFIATLVTGTALSIIFSYYLSTERIKLIDYQLRETANLLINSDISKLDKYDFEKADEMINVELKDNRIGKLFYIFNDKKEILFKSKAAILSRASFPTSPVYLTQKYKNKIYRVLNLNLPEIKDRTLQVALILDTEDFEIYFTLKKLITYLLIVSIPIYLVSYLLTTFLFNPIVLLANYLKKVGFELKQKGEIPPKPDYFKTYNEQKKKDEFSILINEVDSFIDKLSLYNKVSKPWSYRLAHELKTPLSYAILEIDEIKDLNENQLKQIINVKKYLKKVSELISSFLDWSTSDSSFKDVDHYSINMGKSIKENVTEFNQFYSNRIKYNLNNNFNLICNPIHLNNVLTNLISNSLKYTGDRVEIYLENYKLTIIDFGPGLPDSVNQGLGQPFNFGNKEKKGNGLGLAWVMTICKLYFWEINFIKNTDNFTVVINFSKSKFGLDL